MSKTALKINFSAFWPGFNKTDNFFYNLLAEKYEVTISEQPDIYFYDAFDTGHIKYNCTKVFFTGENVRPDFMLCDFAFSFDYPVTKRNYRLPLYALYHDVTTLINRPVDAEAILKSKTKFCCFLVSNAGSEIRNSFFQELSKYKQVDSGGRAFNNIGYFVDDKWAFIKDYKFVIAFENTSYPGYTTEKIYEPLINSCVPIYWGNPLVEKDFNTKAFINCHEYASFEDVIKRIIEVDNNDELYKQYLTQPVFTNNVLNDDVKKENIAARLNEIVAYHFNGKIKLHQKIRPAYFLVKNTARNLNTQFAILKTIPKRVLKKLSHS
ncbi:glycosyltransferase [Inquilinus sp. KBS0705]|nr:glycosyltransferase [Inquilinus sp. KBS0705]